MVAFIELRSRPHRREREAVGGGKVNGRYGARSRDAVGKTRS
jgi:hypothetical protein